MKVISGKYKGRKLMGFDIVGTRPTMDRVKESLFAMIYPWIDQAIVLDLFAGSGNLGIEALSQGAKYAYFVDKNKKACQIINTNIDMLNIRQGEIFCGDYQKALRDFVLKKISFDIIFLDPPYQTDLVEKSVSFILKENLLNKKGIIVVESDKLEKVSNFDMLEVVKMKKYGDKWVAILRRV